MEQNAGNKIRMYILSLSFISCAILLLITVIAGNQVSNISSKNEYIIDEIVGKSIHLQQAHISLEKMRSGLKDIANYNTDTETLEQSRSKIYSSRDNFFISLERYLQVSFDDSDREEINRVLTLTGNEYVVIMENMIESAFNNDIERMKAVLLDAEPIANMLEDYLTSLSERNRAMLDELMHNTAQTRNASVVILIVIVTSAILLIFLFSLWVISAVNKKLNEASAEAVNTNDNANYQRVSSAFSSYTTDKRNDSEDAKLLLNEFGKCISDLKAVAYDLTKITKDRNGK